MSETPQSGLRRSLSGLHLWGIAVGLVISGEYFGWSYGWAGQASFSGGALSGIFATIPFAIWFFLAIEGAAVLALGTMIYFNPIVFGLFVGMMAVGFLFYRFTADLRDNAEADELLTLAQTEARSLAD